MRNDMGRNEREAEARLWLADHPAKTRRDYNLAVTSNAIIEWRKKKYEAEYANNRDLWLADHPDKAAADYEAHIAGTERSERAETLLAWRARTGEHGGLSEPVASKVKGTPNKSGGAI